jgi:hypothetical protein
VRCGTKVVRVPRKLRTSENTYLRKVANCRSATVQRGRERKVALTT